MNFFVGLGNPGQKYDQTRHNVGFKMIEKLATRLNADNFIHKDKFQAEIAKKNDAIFIKPQTFMNLSGQAVRAVLDFYHADLISPMKNLFVFHDDLDIEVGKFKIQFGVGPKIHHGLQSIYQQLKTDQFWHIRMGIDGRAGDRTIPGDVYVLQPFNNQENDLLNQAMNGAITELINKFNNV